MTFAAFHLRAPLFIAAAICGIAALAGAQADVAVPATRPRLVLNAPSCAQEIENYRRECVRACETSLMKPQCARSCNDPNKLSPRLAACEQRDKKPG
jgi:hypothetical protein